MTQEQITKESEEAARQEFNLAPKQSKDSLSDVELICFNNFKDGYLKARMLSLEQLTAAEEKIPKWISVEEQLPEHLTRVLVEGGIAYYHARQELWWTVTGCDSPRVIQWKVTHWMPIPEPLPKFSTYNEETGIGPA